MILPEEFVVRVSRREGKCERLRRREEGGAPVANQHVVCIRVRWRLMKAGLSLRRTPAVNDPSWNILLRAQVCVVPPCSYTSCGENGGRGFASRALSNPFSVSLGPTLLMVVAAANQSDSIWKM